MTTAAKVLAVLLLGYGIMVSRAWWEADHELLLGRASIGAKRRGHAVVHFGRALRWYVPGLPANRLAAEHLMELGMDAEAKGDRAAALAAYRELRRGVNATRHLWTPFEDLKARADQRIAYLMAGQGERLHDGTPAPFEARRAEHLELLRRETLPSPGMSLLIAIGFFGWVGSVLAGIYLGLDREGRIRWRPMAAAAASWVTFFSLWLGAMALA